MASMAALAAGSKAFCIVARAAEAGPSHRQAVEEVHRSFRGRPLTQKAGAQASIRHRARHTAPRAVIAPERPKVSVNADAVIELTETPATLLREDDERMLASTDPSGTSFRQRWEKIIRGIQDEVCSAIEELDGNNFREDAWLRPSGGGGITRTLQDGNVFEKAGIAVSVVYGEITPEAYKAATGFADVTPPPTHNGKIPFFAAGISSVIHPKNPMAPTAHFNYRYFEVQGVNGEPHNWWFGGGTDLTPSYLFEEDAKRFHQMYKDVCDKYDPEYYKKMKADCDEYFLIKHRGERRGVGGIIYDNHNDRDKEEIAKFAEECGHTVVPSYIPLVAKHKDDAFTEENKRWQQLRRGRYVEFNVVYDRGTIFGLKTGGRVESILMTLPLTCRWEYDHKPEPGSPEARLLEACQNPPQWV